MHPAYSVIFFTTASGAGYGLLILLGLGNALHLLPEDRWFGGVTLALALALVTGGLLSSTFHLGHPERAWRAFSQWRTSWLSREGVASVATYAPALLFAFGWVVLGQTGGGWAAAGLIAALLAAATVQCTGMIYASLRPIRAWANGFVAPLYHVLAVATGAVWLAALLGLFGGDADLAAGVALVALAVALLLKLGYWRFLDRPHETTSLGTATGLRHLGEVRLLEGPTTLDSYVQKEMGYRIARRHAGKLRRLALLLLFALPAALLAGALAAGGGAEAALAVLAALSASIGIVIERWLFFAEARHTANLYFGGERA